MKNKKNYHMFKYAFDQPVWILWPDNSCRHCLQPMDVVRGYKPRKGFIHSRTQRETGEDYYEVHVLNSDFTLLHRKESEVFRTRKDAVAADRAEQGVEVKTR